MVRTGPSCSRCQRAVKGARCMPLLCQGWALLIACRICSAVTAGDGPGKFLPTGLPASRPTNQITRCWNSFDILERH